MPMHSADEAIRSGMTGPDVGTARQAGRIRGLRGNSLGISLMLIAEYGLGIGVNLYVRVPAADRGNVAIAGAAVSGASFVSDSKAGASMAMAVLTGIALVCYLGNLFAVRPAAPR